MTFWRVVLTIVVAVLLVGTVASWSRSCTALDMVTYRVGAVGEPGSDADHPALWTYRSGAIGITHRHGIVRVLRTHQASVAQAREDLNDLVSAQGFHTISLPMSLVAPPEKKGWAKFDSAMNWNVLGLAMKTTSRTGNESWSIEAPHWMFCAVFGGVLLKIAVVPWFRWRRGRCPKCAYDLRGVLAASCPQCKWDRGDTAPGVQETREVRKAA